MFNKVKTFRYYLDNIIGIETATAKRYVFYLSRFLTYAESQHWQLNAISESQFEHYLSELQLSDNLAATTYTAAKHYFNYLLVLGETDKNPFLYFHRHVIPEKIHRIYTKSDIDALLSVPNLNTLIGIRNRTIMQLLYDTGLRSHELCKLHLTDIDFEHQYLRIIGKRNKERLVPLHDNAFFSIKRYLIYRPEMLSRNISTPFLFVTTHGNPFSNKTLWCVVKSCAKAAGLDNGFTVHTLRHSFASHMLDNGADLRIVQLLLGHKSITTTKIYTHIDRNNLKILHQKNHPRSQLQD